MDGPTLGDNTGRRISLFCIGLAVAAFSAFVGWVTFTLSATDFYTEWWPGWIEARARLTGDPVLGAMVGAAAAFTCLSVVVMGWAVLGYRVRHRFSRFLVGR